MAGERAVAVVGLVALACWLAAARISEADEVGTMPPVPPTVEEVLAANGELKADSDLVARLRVESVDRWMSYGGVCIEIRSSWYVARCRVVKQLHGTLPDDAETVDVLFWTKTNATVLGHYLPPERLKRDGFANHVALDRRPIAKREAEPIEFVAFLRSSPAVHPLKPEDVPMLFSPTPGFGEPLQALVSLSSAQIVAPD